jgi:thioredoxin-related protein
MKKLLALICFSIVAVALPAAEASGWTTDYKAALEQAKAEDRRVFLFFTGSDWCGWCKRLNREILSTPEFQKFAGEKLVLVELDFPKSKPQAGAVKAQNAKLARQFRIEGYPTVIVLDSTGKKVGELGYQEGGPAPFIEAIGKM